MTGTRNIFILILNRPFIKLANLAAIWVDTGNKPELKMEQFFHNHLVKIKSK